MLAKFSVTNFKGFNDEFVFDLQNTNSYEFNSNSIVNGIVNNALIYGHNGVGKSNLGLAIFDIVGHLTDKNINEIQYNSQVYLNALSKKETAFFKYEFLFGTDRVIYQYEKVDVKTIISESIKVNGKELASINRKTSNTASINIIGAETLKTELDNDKLSLLKYIKNNSVLEENEENNILLIFYNFVDRMLFFRSLDVNMYLGFETGSKGLEEDIIEKGNVLNLEKFLNDAEITCKLAVVKQLDQERIAFDFNGKYIYFHDVASTGTRALILFYYWLQRIKDDKYGVSFLFIDEFDAFYHHNLSALIVKELKNIGIQFILTTHNTSIITNDILRPDCYFLMNKDTVKSLAKRTTKELREAHNIEKMYKAGLFDDE